MKKKHHELLKYLSSQNHAQTSNELANALQISNRSVKNYVSEINALYHKKLILASRNGYELNPQVSLQLLLNEHEDGMIPQTNEERAFYIIKQLILEHTTHLELFDLCDDLCISYSTIKSVISKMNKTFSSYHVEFICENDRVQIIGNEKDKRRLISYVIYEEAQNSFIDTHQLKECFMDINIDSLTTIITQTFRKFDFYLNDFAMVNMLLHLVIIIDRELSGNELSSNEQFYEIDNENEQMFMDELCQRLEMEFMITLNKYERFEIYMLFKSNANYSLPANEQELCTIVGKDILDLTHYYVEQVNNLYVIDLHDPSFITPFALHLKNLLFRAKMNRYTSNPMADSIKLNSPIVFDIAIFIGLNLMERYQISLNEDEIAFLALHIGAEIERQNQNRSKAPAVLLCPDYRNICIMLLNKLLVNFGNQINIIKTIHSEDELKAIKTHECTQILFTTIPLKKYPAGFTVIEISPFNIQTHFEQIQEVLYENQNAYKNYKLRTNFHNFFESDLFMANSAAATRENVIHQLCDRLVRKNYVDKEFEESVLKREYAATTAFSNLAIPHSIHMDAIKTCISVAVSKKGIQWGTNTVHLVLLMAINKADKKTFRELYESLISIFSEPSVLQEVRACISFGQFEALIYDSITAKEDLH